MKGPLGIVFGFAQNVPPISLILGSIGLISLLISLILLIRKAVGTPTPGMGWMGMGSGENLLLALGMASIVVAITIPIADEDDDTEYWPCFSRVHKVSPVEDIIPVEEEIILSWDFNSDWSGPSDLVWTVHLHPPVGPTQSLELPQANQMSVSLSEFAVDDWLGTYAWQLEGNTSSGNWCPADVQREFERVGGTPTSTETGTPTPTQPTATPSQTPTITPTPTDVCDVAVMVHALSDFNCRTGPSADFPVVGYLMDEESAVVHAQSSSGFPWYVIENPDAPPAYCYVCVFDGTIFLVSGDVNCLPVQQDPVLPVDITPIITPLVCKATLDKAECERAGGTWVEPLTAYGKSYCDCD